jgi:hypothetical protein
MSWIIGGAIARSSRRSRHRRWDAHHGLLIGGGMLDRVLKAAQRSEVRYICLAADLLGAMIRELRCLEANHGYLAPSMAVSHGVQKRLRSLLGIIELLRFTRDADRSVELISRAKALISELASELEELASQAERDYNSTPRVDCFANTAIPY